MLTTLLTLLGGGLGGLLRFIPEVLNIFGKLKEQEHEYNMTKLQLEIDQARASQQIDLAHAQAAIAESAGQMAAWGEALKSQGQMTGVKWIDAINQSVRPVITYWWMALFSVYKGCAIWWACNTFVSTEIFLGKLWTAQDAGVLSTIIGFWFVDRVILRNQGKR